MALARPPLHQISSLLRNPPYICRSCKSQLQNLRSAPQSRGYVSQDNLPLTEKIRRKIWGTDNPPGLADPYGGPSFLEKRKMKREVARRNAAGIEDGKSGSIPTRDVEQNYTQQLHKTHEDQSASLPYVEAENWDGLEHIGHLGNWRDFPPEPLDNYVSWHKPAAEAASNRQELLSCLHQSIVECLTCRQHQIDPENVLLLDPQMVDAQLYISASIVPSQQISQVQFSSQSDQDYLAGLLTAASPVTDDIVDRESSIESNASPQKSTDFESENVQQQELERDDGLETNDIERFPVQLTNTGAVYYKVSDESFLQAKLNFHEPFAFMILKRFSQLSGHRVPDHILSATVSGNKPLSYVLDRVYDVIKPKPKNLAQILMSKPALAGQGNVWVLPRRETPVDKEKEVGRWKVIERELQDRGLPVLGKLHS